MYSSTARINWITAMMKLPSAIEPKWYLWQHNNVTSNCTSTHCKQVCCSNGVTVHLDWAQDCRRHMSKLTSANRQLFSASAPSLTSVVNRCGKCHLVKIQWAFGCIDVDVPEGSVHGMDNREARHILPVASGPVVSSNSSSNCHIPAGRHACSLGEAWSNTPGVNIVANCPRLIPLYTERFP